MLETFLDTVIAADYVIATDTIFTSVAGRGTTGLIF
jgi:hypothetical protein